MANVSLKTRTGVCATTLRKGELAEIISWRSCPSYQGEIVLRNDTYLFMLGRTAGHWSNVFTHPDHYQDCIVRILDPTEVVELTNSKREESDD